MKKQLFLLSVVVCAFFFSRPSQAQETASTSGSIYLELLGPSVIMSINFDSRFISGEKLGFGYRAGIGYGVENYQNEIGRFFDNDNPDISYLLKAPNTVYTIPLSINYLFGQPGRASSFEAGAGITILTKKVSIYNYEMDRPGNLIGHLSFMYRFTPVRTGLTFRIGFTPIIGTAGDLFPMAAIGFGYAF
jgi:hypothetical protein